MSTSRHPIALDLERRVGGTVRLLAIVMALPLVDGVFAALVLAGALDTVGGILQVGLLVFGGSATVAVVLADLEGNPRSYVGQILLLGIGLVALAGIETALAPTIRSVVDLVIFERFAALVILAIAASTASARVGEYLPRPAIIVGLGLIASFDPAGATLVVDPHPAQVLRGMAAAGVGVGFAALLALFGPVLRGLVDLDRFRFGSAIALGVLPFSLLGVVPGAAPLAVLAVASLLSFDPGTGDTPRDRATEEDRESRREGVAKADGGSEDEEERSLDAAIANVADQAEDRAPWW